MSVEVFSTVVECKNGSRWTLNIMKGLSNVFVTHFHWEISTFQLIDQKG